MKKIILVFTIMVVFLMAAGCSSNEQTKKPGEKKQEVVKENVELTISAAVSLQNALNEIKAAFEKENPHIKIIYNFGASGALQQQISQGAPVDLFFSAAEDKFDQLVQEGLIDKTMGTDLVGNEIVLVVPKEVDKGINGFKDLTNATKISIGTPETVPAGQYAKDTLEYLNLWEHIQTKIVFAKDVRQVLTYVETGNVDAGIVYKTDALSSKKVKVVATAKETSHEPIIYPVGVVTNSSHSKEAQLFYDYLNNKKSLEIFEKFGFKGLNKE